MRRHPPLWISRTRYVLIYPARNVSFQSATHAYSDLMVDADETFQAVTIEQTVDAAFNADGATKDHFRVRYLW